MRRYAGVIVFAVLLFTLLDIIRDDLHIEGFVIRSVVFTLGLPLFGVLIGRDWSEQSKKENEKLSKKEQVEHKDQQETI